MIRQRQITETQQRAAAEAQAAKERKEGGVGDGLSDLVNGWTFGLVDLGQQQEIRSLQARRARLSSR